MNVTIREMLPEDIPPALKLWVSCDGVEVSEGDSTPELIRYLRRNPGISAVAESAGLLIGAVLGGHDGRRGYIYHLAVSPAHRRTGLGRSLTQHVLTRLKAEGIVRVLLLVAADNGAGQKFWLRERWEKLEFAFPMGIDL